MKRRATLLALAALFGSALAPGIAAAHTEADVIAVPAGAEATLKLKPTHGCGDSPTVAVAIRAPLEGATAGEVDGWTASTEDDGQGNTVLEWTEGSLPADQAGEFPVTFTAPDTPGELLLFPSIQTCENGEELAWISGDPAADYPAPRLLILPAGSAPATSIDEVPADAPGRDQLAEIVDVDNPEETTTSEPDDTVDATTTVPPTTAPDDGPESDVLEETGDSSEDDSSNVPLVVIGVLALVGVGVGIALAMRKGRTEP